MQSPPASFRFRICPITSSLILVTALLLAAQGMAQERDSYSPHAGRAFASEVFWGDTHVHSSWSPDAGAGGNRLITPDEAYQFARGEAVVGHNGEAVRLRRPLDFLVVADHSEYMGLYPLLDAGDPAVVSTETGARWAKLIEDGRRTQVGVEFALKLPQGEDLIRSPAFQRKVWDGVIANAERYNEPGLFTAFIGYEWTSMPGGANLHRIVLFADGEAETSQVVPFRSIDSDEPEALWRYLADYEQKTGGRAMAIPHNSNLSAGRMFELIDSAGEPFSKAYASDRRRWEPLVEATQIKGDSETAPYLSPEDEFADFGTWDQARGMGLGSHEDWMYEGEYLRPALGNGIALAERLGVNPFEFGLIGSTDSHSGLATADDADFWGKFSSNEPHANRAEEAWSANFMPREGTPAHDMLLAAGFGKDIARSDQTMTWKLVASGYAAVWAQENTRAALFDAMMRRETYATTGPRMVVRFFGGWEFDKDDAVAPDLAAVGYAKGVPMGGVLGARPKGGEPVFLVSSLRDPEGANLDRIQIVKQWTDAGGRRFERIFDVAVSDGRKIDSKGRARASVGNTVEVETARYENTIGASALTAVWQDPDFDEDHRAVYYVRVLEIPTPRWTTYDAARFGTPLDERYPKTIQERAYTSPIWYSPGD